MMLTRKKLARHLANLPGGFPTVEVYLPPRTLGEAYMKMAKERGL